MAWLAGDTFVNAPAPNLRSHLWMVISDPSLSLRVVIVNATSWHVHQDDSCILDVGDHPFFTHKSYVSYADAKLRSTDVLDLMARKELASRWERLRDDVLERVRHGAAISEELPNESRTVLREQELGIRSLPGETPADSQELAS